MAADRIHGFDQNERSSVIYDFNTKFCRNCGETDCSTPQPPFGAQIANKEQNSETLRQYVSAAVESPHFA